jgi:tRNA dimethylallyltransferase
VVAPESRRDRRRLLAVVGATATGKSALAFSLARRFQGEVVNCDAYQIYRGMDVGTAKVGEQERRLVPHHLIDIAEPSDNMTLRRFLDVASAALDDVWSRGSLPVLAGGSGQYVWALLEGWQVPRIEPDQRLRGDLEALAAELGPEALLARLREADPEAAERLDPRNVRRLVRALEVVLASGRPLSACQTRRPLDAETLIVGLRLPRDELYERLDRRTDAMFDAGFVEEVRRLRDQGFGETPPVRGGIGYKEVSLYLDGEIDLDEAMRRMKNANHRLVRRQGAWFREGDPRIHWLDAGEAAVTEAEALVERWLATQS